MATRSHTDQPNTESQELDIPNPFPTPLDSETEKEAEDAAAFLYEVQTDTRALADQQAEMYLERGDYIWKMDTLTVRVGFNDADREASDVASKKGLNKGRCIVNVFGVVVPKDGKGRGGRFSFSFSPDKRYRRDASGNLVEPVELDMFSKPYTQLTEFFFQQKERQIRHEGEIIDLVKSGLYSMYVTKSKAGGNFLGQIKALSA